MGTYQLKELDIYIVNVFSKKDAVIFALLNKIGVTENDIVLTDYSVDRDCGVGIVCRSYQELKQFLNNK